MNAYIVTFYSSQENYGQLLQAFALQTYLEKKGYNVRIVRNTDETKKMKLNGVLKAKLRTAFYLRKSPFLLCRLVIKNFIEILSGKFELHRIDRSFDKFRYEYLHLTDKIYQNDELSIEERKDIYITGSDQIWNSGNPFYYLNWVPDSCLKISYAASFGRSDFSDEFIQTISPWLKQYNKISVRENSGIKVCKQAGITNVTCVPDPTLLLDVSTYQTLSEKAPVPQKKYLLLYLLGTRTNIYIPAVYDYASKHGLEVIYVGAQGRIDTYKKVAPTIEEWISLIRHASFIVTNSFHGVVFSLLFNRDFMAFQLTGSTVGMNDRLHTLLHKVDLDDRINEDGIYINENPINYISVNDKIKNYRQTGIQFLETFA